MPHNDQGVSPSKVLQMSQSDSFLKLAMLPNLFVAIVAKAFCAERTKTYRELFTVYVDSGSTSTLIVLTKCRLTHQQAAERQAPG